MKVWHVSFACEKKERSLAMKLIGPNIASEAVVMAFSTDNGDEQRVTPMAYAPDLKSNWYTCVST